MIWAIIFTGLAIATTVIHLIRHRAPHVSLEDRLRGYHVS